MCPRATFRSDSRCRGVSPAQLHRWPGLGNRLMSPISAMATAASTGPSPGSCSTARQGGYGPRRPAITSSSRLISPVSQPVSWPAAPAAHTSSHDARLLPAAGTAPRTAARLPDPCTRTAGTPTPHQPWLPSLCRIDEPQGCLRHAAGKRSGQDHGASKAADQGMLPPGVPSHRRARRGSAGRAPAAVHDKRPSPEVARQAPWHSFWHPTRRPRQIAAQDPASSIEAAQAMTPTA